MFKKSLLYSLLFLLTFFLQAQQETKTFLLSKNEYKKFDAAGTLLTEAIKNAFGESDKQNPYRLDLKQANAWNDKTPELIYYPSGPNDSKKVALYNTVISAKENLEIKFKVVINPAKSELNDAIKPFIDKKNTIVLKIIVIGDEKIFVKETKLKTDFFSLIDEHAFADRALRSFFGDSRKMNYSIFYEKFNACFIKDIFSSKCEESFELFPLVESEYIKFNNKITSNEYSANYVLFDLLVKRDKSTFNQQVEKSILKDDDGTEHLKFYYVIPKNNSRAKAKLISDIEGKLVNIDKVPQKELTIYLKDNTQTVIASQKTDSKGYFKFEKLIEGGNYSLSIDLNASKEKTLYITTKKDIMVAQFERGNLDYHYKLIDAVITVLSSNEEVFPSLEFLPLLKGRMVKVTDKTSPLANQTIELKSETNQLMQSQKTDEQGNFEFKAINPNLNYSIELPDYISSNKNEKIYLSNSKNELIKQFIKNASNKYSFKVIPADLSQLQNIDETDVEMTFSKQKKYNRNEITIQDFVYYSLNSFQISPESKTTLDKIAKIVIDNPLYKLEIISHTDSRGDQNENQKLSEKRSEAVMNYLIGKKIESGRLKPSGFGEGKPLNGCVDGVNCIEEEYKMNRRTEFKFYK
jgi:outer membrane protein OmpA-like peptidoglycan-associated protein